MVQSTKHSHLVFLEVIVLSHLSIGKYLGCFHSNSSTSVLNGPYYRSSNMTVATCYSKCISGRYDLYALQYGRYCYCGTHESKYEIFGGARESECRTSCAGSSNCGGENFLSVYVDHTYVGCFEGLSASPFRFGGPVTDLTLESCLLRCRSVYKYVGLFQGNKCYCSNVLPTESSKQNDSFCFDRSVKCTGGEKCGGSGKVAVWTSVEDHMLDGSDFRGCFHGLNFQFYYTDIAYAQCSKVCGANQHTFFAMNLEGTCFCGDSLPSLTHNVYKTMKLLYSYKESYPSFSLKILCNTSNNGYLRVWAIISNQSQYEDETIENATCKEECELKGSCGKGKTFLLVLSSCCAVFAATIGAKAIYHICFKNVRIHGRGKIALYYVKETASDGHHCVKKSTMTERQPPSYESKIQAHHANTSLILTENSPQPSIGVVSAREDGRFSTERKENKKRSLHRIYDVIT